VGLRKKCVANLPLSVTELPRRQSVPEADERAAPCPSFCPSSPPWYHECPLLVCPWYTFAETLLHNCLRSQTSKTSARFVACGFRKKTTSWACRVSTCFTSTAARAGFLWDWGWTNFYTLPELHRLELSVAVSTSTPRSSSLPLSKIITACSVFRSDDRDRDVFRRPLHVGGTNRTQGIVLAGISLSAKPA